MSASSIVLRRLHDSGDGSLVELSRLLQDTFPDPDTVLDLDRLQAFLAERQGSRDRQFCIVVAEQDGVFLGGTVFSYVPATNCGFSEYLVVRKERHGQRIGRLLFDARRTLLDDLARTCGHPSCTGLFIEADNPQRIPPDLRARERETAMDVTARLLVFAHFGFAHVEMAYVQPPLGPGKQSVRYLDLLFCAWNKRVQQGRSVPVECVWQTLCPIWASWAPQRASRDCDALRQRLGSSPVRLAPISRPAIASAP
ncbi:MAG: GNAT family N-acetyltransferase [Chloroflexota bacterium]